MLKTAPAALFLLRKQGVITLTPSPGVRSLIGEIVGAPVRGSWWAHPKGKLIYGIATRLEDSPDVLTAKLVSGKTTFVHRALWPALYRVVSDATWRRARSRELPPLARRIASTATKRGELRLDHFAGRDRKAATRARSALERACIMHVSSEHTESGHHATVVRAWSRWASADVKAAAARLSFESALAELANHGLDLA